MNFRGFFKTKEQMKQEEEYKKYLEDLKQLSQATTASSTAKAYWATRSSINPWAAYGTATGATFKFHNWLKRKPSTVEGFPEIVACHPYGSRFTCDPAPTDTDDDTLVLVKEFPNPVRMKELGWEMDGAEKYGDSYFQSYRREFKNLIMVENRSLYIRGVAAALVCKQLNLLNKDERIAVHAVVMGHGYTAIEAPLPNRGLL